jgi:seryl-tRNA synthetase
MLDIKLIRKDPRWVEAKLKAKDPDIDLAPILDEDQMIRDIKTKVEELKSKRNQLSKTIGEKKRNQEDVSKLMEEVGGLGDEIAALDKKEAELAASLEDKLSRLPNLPADGIKISFDPKENVVIKTHGEKPTFSFPFKNHVELNERLHLFDFKGGAKTSGSNWAFYTDLGARLEWALLNYMIDTHLENRFVQIIPPLLVKPEIMYGSGQLPKFSEQVYKLTDKDYQLYMIPTSEVVLNGLHYDEIMKEEELPKKYFSYTPCFRRESGAAGTQERGLIRMHQFNKVEMFCFTKPEESEKVFDEMVRSAENILQGLGLHYRLTLLVTGDMSYAASKTVDVEVWLPGQNRYYEVSSISNCTDFQARRSQIRFKRKEEKPEFVHTLNGSGLATSRLMVALLENNQKEDGSVELPTILHQYFKGLTQLTPEHR